MDLINNNPLRNGNFTSSEIIALYSEPTATAKKQGEIFGKGALTYIEECNMERDFELSLECDIDAQPTNWGKCVERIAFNNLGSDYDLTSQATMLHKQYDFWAGSRDGLRYIENEKTVYDIKCPVTRKSFYQLVKPLYKGLSGWDTMTEIRENHKDGDKYYKQLVSNSIISECDFAELIVFMPFERELSMIKERAKELYDEGETQYYSIAHAKPGKLPYIKNKGMFNNVNVIRFKVPEIDKQEMTELVLKASKLLIPRQQ